LREVGNNKGKKKSEVKGGGKIRKKGTINMAQE